MYCSKCGAELPDNARFCTSCGSLISTHTKSSPQSVYVPSAVEGKENKTGNGETVHMVSPGSDGVEELKKSTEKKPETSSKSQVSSAAPGKVKEGGNKTEFELSKYTSKLSDKKSRDPKKEKFIIGAVAVAVAFVAVVAVFLISREKSNQKTGFVAEARAIETDDAAETVTEYYIEESTIEESQSVAVVAETITEEKEKTTQTAITATELVIEETTTEELTTEETTTEEPTTKEIKNGWFEQNGVYYYYRNDEPVRDTFINDNGNTYYLQSDGSLHRGGWLLYGGAYYYIDSHGSPVRGNWVNDGSGTYYLDENGVMQTGWHQLSGKWYYLGIDGKRCANGWYTIDGQDYCFDNGGAMYVSTTTPDGKQVDDQGHLIEDNTVYSDVPDKLKGYYSCFEEEYELVLKFSEDGTFQARRTYQDSETNFKGKYKCNSEDGLITFSRNSVFSGEPQYYDIEIIMVDDLDYGMIAVYRD